MVSIMRPRPRILHLFSDWKWTGPAEPTVNLCRHLRRRGYVVDFACARPPGDQPQALEYQAEARHVEPVLDFHLKKRLNLFTNLNDIRALTEYIDRGEVEIVHVHSSHDHYIGSRAARKANNQPFVVRTNHLGVPIPPKLRYRWVMRGHTHGWVALTQSCLEADVRNFGLDASHAIVVEGAVDLERFDADKEFADVRGALGISREEVVACVVARAQRHRRFDVLLAALEGAMKEEPSLRAMILGRGTHFDALVRRPVRELGISEKVILPGYRTNDYVDYLAAADFKVFLVPGSDGSCRAVREAMALGKPVIASRHGLLPELVEDGRCGLVVDDTPDDIMAAILRMTRDREMREQMGRNARAKAREKFDIERQVEAISELYMRLAEGT